VLLVQSIQCAAIANLTCMKYMKFHLLKTNRYIKHTYLGRYCNMAVIEWDIHVAVFQISNILKFNVL